MFVLFVTEHKRGQADVIRTGSKLTEPDEHGQRVKDMKRLLAKAEQKIRKLEDKVTDQKQQLREIKALARHEENLAAEREDLKAEITALKAEIGELTRANREHVEKFEMFRAENVRLKAGVKDQKPDKSAAGANLQGLSRLSLP